MRLKSHPALTQSSATLTIPRVGLASLWWVEGGRNAILEARFGEPTLLTHSAISWAGSVSLHLPWHALRTGRTEGKRWGRRRAEAAPIQLGCFPRSFS